MFSMARISCSFILYFHLQLIDYLTCDISLLHYTTFDFSESKVGPLIVKQPPPLPKPRRIPQPIRREILEPKPRRILSHKRSLQAVTALAITVGVLLLAVIVSMVIMLKRNTKGRPTYVNIYNPIKHVFQL